MAASADPFISVCKVLEEKLKTTRLKFDLWKSTVSLVDTSADADCQAKRKDLEREIASASDGCFKMRKALDHVEQNRGLEKYSHIDDRELESRKAFVQRLEAVRGTPGREPPPPPLFCLSPIPSAPPLGC
jgi:hypothetical protein